MTNTTPTRRINSTLPAATLEQRVACLSTLELIDAARALGPKADEVSDKVCTAVLEQLERRMGLAFVEALAAEIYA